MLATGRTTEAVECPCGHGFEASVVKVLNLATHPELADSLLAERLNQVRCPECAREFHARTHVFVNDPDHERYVGCFPAEARGRELQLRVAFYQQLLELGAEIPVHVRSARFAFGPEDWAGALGRSLPASPFGGERDELDLPELSDVVLPSMDADELDPTIALLEPDERPAAGRDGERELGGPIIQELQEEDFEEVDDLALLERRRAALVQRWRESGQTHYAFLEGGTLTLFQLHPEPEAFDNRADLFFQLHRTENFPLIALLLVGEGQADNQVLYWLFNLDNRADVHFLRTLATRFEVRLHLFDRSYTPRQELLFSQALERNVAYVLQQAQAWLSQIEPNRRNFFIAASKFDAAAYRRLGRLPKGPPIDAFRDLPTPGVTRLALDILIWWSRRDHYEYLIFIKSFPVDSFQSILAAVLERAIHFGLAMTEKMNRMAVELGLVADPVELIQRQLDGAAAVARGESACDLQPADLAENWRVLLAAARASGVRVAKQHEELAAAARLQASEQADAIPLDLDDEIEIY